jgi:arsenate reductase
MTSSDPHIVFVCIENSNRSQMAEAFARIHGPANLKPYSSGSRPSGIVNPKAIASMSEKHYDLSRHQSKGLGDLPDIEWDAVVTMGCGDACPSLRAKRRIDWQILDPKHLTPEEFRVVRNTIETKVQELLATLQTEPPPPK